MSLDIIKRYHIKAKKSLGQNFLVNEEVLNSIASFFPTTGKNIVEVGPGYGALTEKILFEKPNSLTLVELDERMIQILSERQKVGELDTKNITFSILSQDVLTYIPNEKEYILIANIPYYITSPILRHFIYNVDNHPTHMLILMQKDVGDKILGGKKQKSSVLSLLVSKKYLVSKVIDVPNSDFIPAPKVDSSVLFFEKHGLYEEVENDKFMNLIKIGFASNRKKLYKNLLGGGLNKQKVEDAFCSLHIDKNIRGEDIDIKNWCLLIAKL